MNKAVLLASAFSLLSIVPDHVSATESISSAQLAAIIGAESLATNDLTTISADTTNQANNSSQALTEQSQICALLKQLAINEINITASYQSAGVTAIVPVQEVLGVQVNNLLVQEQLLQEALMPPQGPTTPSKTVAAVPANNLLNATRAVLTAEVALYTTVIQKTSILESSPFLAGPGYQSLNQELVLVPMIQATEREIANLTNSGGK